MALLGLVYLCFWFFCLVIVSFVYQVKAFNSESHEACTLYFSNGVVLPNVPIAKTVELQTKGLAGRDEVGIGMFFSWDNAEPRVFWMRDTRVPLSIGFFDEEGFLFLIEDMEPESDRYHFSVKPASAALELEQGQFQAYSFDKGIRLVGRICSFL